MKRSPIKYLASLLVLLVFTVHPSFAGTSGLRAVTSHTLKLSDINHYHTINAGAVINSVKNDPEYPMALFEIANYDEIVSFKKKMKGTQYSTAVLFALLFPAIVSNSTFTGPIPGEHSLLQSDLYLIFQVFRI
jgi:hypothetical protein